MLGTAIGAGMTLGVLNKSVKTLKAKPKTKRRLKKGKNGKQESN